MLDWISDRALLGAIFGMMVYGFWWQGIRREEQWYVDQNQRMAIIKRLREIEEKIDNMARK
jgi:hypothetical protein|tara:strand:+ start:323 stop:505 length:183 start_codon:yes stop_codon:yes gene_type:complete